MYERNSAPDEKNYTVGFPVGMHVRLLVMKDETSRVVIEDFVREQSPFPFAARCAV